MRRVQPPDAAGEARARQARLALSRVPARSLEAVLTLSPVVLAAAAASVNLGLHALGLDVDVPGVAE